LKNRIAVFATRARRQKHAGLRAGIENLTPLPIANDDRCVAGELRQKSLHPATEGVEIAARQRVRAGENGEAGNNALHLAIENLLNAARHLQHATESVLLVLSVMLIDSGRGKSDQR
jgi:hypothetical protein